MKVRTEVEGDSSSYVAARGLDGRRGYTVWREALASVLGEGDTVTVNTVYSIPPYPGALVVAIMNTRHFILDEKRTVCISYSWITSVIAAGT